MALIKKAKPADAIDEDAGAFEPSEAALAEAEDSSPEPVLDAIAAEPEQPESPDASNDLLNMFTEVGIETVDRSTLLNLAGEVEMSDLVSELRIVAAALGVIREQHEAAAEPGVPELAAA